MSNLLSGLLSVLMSTNQPAAASNLITQKTGLKVEIPNPNDPVEKEYQALLNEDNKAHEEIDQWIKGNVEFSEKGVGTPKEILQLKIEQRLEKVKERYETFVLLHPKHAKGRVAYGSFLNDQKNEEGAKVQWEKARELNSQDPAVWNNLANYYGHNGDPKTAFDYYAKAIELNPQEPVYYGNLAVTVYMFRHDAVEHFKISEKEVFDKALGYYKKALELDPENFVLATDYAQSYYGIKPPRWEEAVALWKEVLKLGRDDIEREGVHLHLARCYINLSRYQDAENELGQVKHGMYTELKKRITRNLQGKQKAAAGDKPDA
jgi:tetratricopeptide (TPR) repeat protein